MLRKKNFWCNSDDLPVDAEFMEVFLVTQKNQRLTTRAVMMSLTFSRTISVNNIKFHPTAWAIVSQKNVFVHPDKFDQQDIACPVYLVNIQPRLVWKETLLQEI